VIVKTHAKTKHTITNQLQEINNKTQDLTWFGRQLQPTSTRATIRFYFFPVAYQITSTMMSLNRDNKGTQ